MSVHPGRNDLCPCGSGKKYKKCCEASGVGRTLIPQAALAELAGLFQAGRYAEVESRARLLLQQRSDWGLVWKLLGTALGVQGKNAFPALQKAAQLLPNDAEVPNNIGYFLKELGRLQDAAISFRQALTLNPNYADAHNNLGLVLHALGRHKEAVASYRRALAIRHEDAEVHNNLGVSLNALGEADAAVLSYRQALAFNPDDAGAHNNLGIALQRLGQCDASIASYRRALEIKPDCADVYSNLGGALQEQGQLDQALACCKKALLIKSDYAGAHNNLGYVFKDMGETDAAIACYRRALEINPAYAGAHNNLGLILLDSGQLDAALASFRRALACEPDFTSARSNLLFALNQTASNDATSCLEEARTFGCMVSRQVDARFMSWQCANEPERLNIGIVSGDLRNHPVGFALESLLAQLDPTRLKLIAYPTSPKLDELSARLRPYFAEWHPIYGKSDAEAAQLIHADGVQILLDLSGHTAHNRLPVFAWKPAPIQASWLGYFATSGMAEMDYLLTSEVAVPEAHRDHFTERLWYLPDIWLCFTPPQSELPVSALPALQNGYLTFACFQRLGKISEATLNAWGKIFKALADARLLLASKQLGNPATAEQFKQRLQRQGIDPARVVMLGAAATRENYLARYNAVDIMLDTFPYPGVTTTCEALWMGVPTITRVGESLLSRQGAGMVTPAGLSDWVALGEDEYVARAIQHASDLPKLAALRAGLRQQVLSSPVFDAPRFARHFEDALWGMWRQRQGREL